jgi:tetratricopeptide (TPR) repeat protein
MKIHRASMTILSLTLVAGAVPLTGCGGREITSGPRGDESGRGTRPLHAMEKAGDLAFDAGNYADAAPHYQEYVDVAPNRARVRYKLGRSYAETGDFKRARENLQVAYDLAPSNEEYINALADSMYNAGEAELLSTFLTKLTNERGTAADYLRLGEYSQKIGNADEAVAALLTAARLDAGASVTPQLALARFYKAVGDRPREIERLRMVYFMTPNNQEMLERARALGEIVGPTWGLRPVELEAQSSGGAPAR